MTRNQTLLIAAGVAAALYFYSKSRSAGVVASASISNLNAQSLYSPVAPVGNGGTTSGILKTAGLVGAATMLGDLATLTQPNAQNYAGNLPDPTATGYAIQTGAATPYSNGPNTYYADAYNSSPPDPIYTASLLAGDPSIGTDE